MNKKKQDKENSEKQEVIMHIKKKVELLIFVDEKSPLCTTNDSFNSLLQSNGDISIIDDKLGYQGVFFDYKLSSDNISSNSEKGRYFNLKITFDEVSDNNVDLLSNLLRQIKNLFSTLFKQLPQTIWDDISYHYSIQAYPLIHEIENILRKLITKFMLINVGTGWTKNSIPDEFRTSKISADKDSQSKPFNQNLLYDADFIQLSYFLFSEYKEINTNELITTIKCLKEGEVNVEAILNLKKFIPTTNWQKYFQKHIDCEAEFLNKKWIQLYDLRCKIAHNNTFTKKDFNDTIFIIDAIKPILINATDKLEVIEVSDTEKTKLVDDISLIEIPQHTPIKVKNSIKQDSRSTYVKVCINIAQLLNEIGELRNPHNLMTITELCNSLLDEGMISNVISDYFQEIYDNMTNHSILDDVSELGYGQLIDKALLVNSHLTDIRNTLKISPD